MPGGDTLAARAAYQRAARATRKKLGLCKVLGCKKRSRPGRFVMCDDHLWKEALRNERRRNKGVGDGR